jgi:hypothetical protein
MVAYWLGGKKALPKTELQPVRQPGLTETENNDHSKPANMCRNTTKGEPPILSRRQQSLDKFHLEIFIVVKRNR